MPKYRITSPDGKTFEVTAPDGASQDDVLAYAQSQFSAKPEGAEWEPKKRTPEMLANSAAEYRDRNPVTDDANSLQNFAAGVGKSLVDTGQGIKQLFSMGGRADRIQSEVDQRRLIDDALMNTKAGIGGNFVGSVAQILTPGAVLKAASLAPRAAAFAPQLGAASSAFLPTSLGGTAAQGAVVGAIQPVASGDSRAGNTLMGLGAGYVGAGIPRVLGALARGTGSYTGKITASGVNKRAGEIIRAEADNPANLLIANPSKIPGAQRTLAEETLDSGLARLERNARSTGKGWDALDRTNNAARVGAIERFAGNEQTLEAAQLARSKAANPIRKEAMQIEGVDTSRLLSQIKRMEKGQEGRPAVQSGLGQLRDLLTRTVPEAERKREALKAMGDYMTKGRKSAADFAAARTAMTSIRKGEVPEGDFTSQAGKDALKEARRQFAQEAKGHDKVAVLDNVRKTIGDMLGGKYGSDNPAALAGSRELMVIKNQLDRVLAKQAPEYGQYIGAFKAGSKPINRMELGQSLMSARSGKAELDPVTGAQVLTPASFVGRARNLDKVAAEATGFRKAKAANILEPEDFAAIRNVQDDLQRRGFAATAGSGGNSQTFERMALNDRVTGGLAGRLPLIGKYMDYLRDVGETRLQVKLSEILANPAQARAILQRLPANDRRVIELALSRVGGVTGASVPAIVE